MRCCDLKSHCALTLPYNMQGHFMTVFGFEA